MAGSPRSGADRPFSFLFCRASTGATESFPVRQTLAKSAWSAERSDADEKITGE
jgi:hypothetical protein